MIDVQSKLQITQQKLITITLELQELINKDTISSGIIKNSKYNSQSKLLRDLIHVLNVATGILETMLFLD